MRAGGPGGQCVNTTDSAVRITHIPTGLVVICQDEKSQIKNKAKAMRVLRSRLYDLEESKKQAERAQNRKSQVGSGDRSERIRTYNFPQNRVTDHRINLTLYKLDSVMQGSLDELIDALCIAAREEIVVRQEVKHLELRIAEFFTFGVLNAKLRRNRNLSVDLKEQLPCLIKNLIVIQNRQKTLAHDNSHCIILL